MLKKLLFSLTILFVIIFAGGVCYGEGLLGQHPSVLVTDSNKAEIIALENDSVYAPVFRYLKSLASRDLPEQTGYFSGSISNQIEAKAFLYAIGMYDEDKARELVEYTTSYVKNSVTAQTYSINMYKDCGNNGIRTGSLVYDWCYDLLSEQQKRDLTKAIYDLYFLKQDTNGDGIIKDTEYVQPCRVNNVGSWGDIAGKAVGQPLIYNTIFAVSLYDTYPEECQVMLNKIRGSMAQAVKTYGEAGALTDGCIAYTREYYSYYVRTVMEEAGLSDVYGDQSRIGYKILYSRLPYGAYIFTGDDYTISTYKIGSYAPGVETAVGGQLGAYYEDGYLWHLYLKNSATASNLDKILFFRTQTKGKLPDTLPLAFKSDNPRAEITARTSWQNGFDSPAVVAYMNMNNRRSGDHDHADIGSFQIYYKGPLAVKSGVYQGEQWGGLHWRNYATRTVASNSLLVYDPDEVYQYGSVIPASNDGGQQMIKNKSNGYVISDYNEHMQDSNLRATEDGSYIGPNKMTPAFSYIKGNLTNAYSDKISDYKRSMVFMDLFEDDYPAAMVVYDRVVSSNKSFKKTWLLHGIEEPIINGNTTTYVADEQGFNGKLVNKTMYPKEFTINTVGGEGREYEVEGVNYPAPEVGGDYYYRGKWRIELSPKNEANEDIFLNAMYVTDADGNLPELKQECIEGDKVLGVSVKDRVVTFSKDGKPITDSFTVTIPNNGYNEVMCLFTDVAEGNWKAGRTIIKSESGTNAVMMSLIPGTYTVTKVNNLPTTKTYEQAEKEMLGDFIIKKDGVYIYQPAETKLYNGVPYIDAVAILPQLDAKIESTNPLRVSKMGKTAEISEGFSYMLDGVNQTISAENKIVDGRMIIPVAEFSKLLNMTVTYNADSLVMTCESHPALDFAEDAIMPVSVNTSIITDTYRLYDKIGGTDIKLSKNFDYVTYDLGDFYEIDECIVKGSGQFIVKGSADGENFYEIITAARDEGDNVYVKECSGVARYVTLVSTDDVNIDEFSVIGKKFEGGNYLFCDEKKNVPGGGKIAINTYTTEKTSIYFDDKVIAETKGEGYECFEYDVPQKSGIHTISMRKGAEKLFENHIFVYMAEHKGEIFSDNFNSGTKMTISNSTRIVDCESPFDESNAKKISFTPVSTDAPYILRSFTVLKKGIYSVEFDVYASMETRLNIEIRDHNTAGSTPYPDSGPTYGFMVKEGMHHYKTVIDAENSIIMTYRDGVHIKNTPFRIDDLRQFRFTFHNAERTDKEYILDNVTVEVVESGAYERKTFMPVDADVINPVNGSVCTLWTGENRRAFSLTNAGSDAVAYIDFEESYGADNTVLDFDFKMEKTENGANKLFALNFGSGENEKCEVQTPTVNAETLKIDNAQLSCDQWFNAKYILDFTKNSYSMYIRNYQNGKTYFAGNYSLSGLQSIKRVEFVTGADNMLYIDTLSLYKATEFAMEIVSPKNSTSTASGNIVVNSAKADKIFFIMNGKVVKEFNTSGINTASYEECEVVYGKNELEVIAFCGDEYMKKSVKFDAVTGFTVPDINLFYMKGASIFETTGNFVIPEDAESILLAHSASLKNAKAYIEDRFGNVISGVGEMGSKKYVTITPDKLQSGELVYIVLKSGSEVGGVVLESDVYYPVLIGEESGLCVSDIINYDTETSHHMIYKYVNSSTSTQNTKVFYAEYENSEKLKNIEIKSVDFETGKSEKFDTVSKKEDGSFVKVFKFGKDMKSLR